MSRSPLTSSERASENLRRWFEGHALRLGNRRWKGPQERRSVVVDLPPQQHRVVLVRRVVAVLHEHPAPVSELDRDRDTSVGAEAIDVLAPLLPRGDLAG